MARHTRLWLPPGSTADTQCHGDHEANKRNGWGEHANADEYGKTWAKGRLRGVIRPVRQSLGRKHRSVEGDQEREREE